MALELSIIAGMCAVGWFMWKIAMRMNKFLGNLGFMLLGLGFFFYTIQEGELLFGFGGLLVAIYSLIKMIYDLIGSGK